MRWLITALLSASSLVCCRQQEEITRLPDQQGGFVELTVNGKPLNDPDSPLIPKGVNTLKLSCFAQQESDTTIKGFWGIYRRLWIDLYADGLNDVGQLYFSFVDFNAGSKTFEQSVPTKWQNATTAVSYWDYDVPVGGYYLDESQPQSFVIDRYDPINKFIEGSFSVGYQRTPFKLIMRSTPATIRVQGRFKAKIQLMKQGKSIDWP